MLANNMADAWRRRNGAGGELPAVPAGASAADELYLDAIVGGAADSIDVLLTLSCTSSLPNTYVNCTSGCTA